jgi:hypothetical protein
VVLSVSRTHGTIESANGPDTTKESAINVLIHSKKHLARRRLLLLLWLLLLLGASMILVVFVLDEIVWALFQITGSYQLNRKHLAYDNSQ